MTIELLNDTVKLTDSPLLLFQLALGLLLLCPLYGGLVLHHAPHKLVLVLLGVGNNTLEILEYKLF